MNKTLLEKLNMKEMILTQLSSWELILKKRGLAESTVNRKINDIGQFYMHLTTLKENPDGVKIYNINNILFEYVRDGYFSYSNLENEGTYGYRRAIYHNIQEGLNYIYEGYFKNKKNIINDLTDGQKEILDDISKNKWFKVIDIKDNKHTIQTKLIEESVS